MIEIYIATLVPDEQFEIDADDGMFAPIEPQMKCATILVACVMLTLTLVRYVMLDGHTIIE